MMSWLFGRKEKPSMAKEKYSMATNLPSSTSGSTVTTTAVDNGLVYTTDTTGHTHVNPNQYNTYATADGRPTDIHRISMRMKWDQLGRLQPLDFIQVHTPKNSEWTYVVIAHNNTAPFIIKDDVNLFPSDSLVTQLRLLENK